MDRRWLDRALAVSEGAFLAWVVLLPYANVPAFRFTSRATLVVAAVAGVLAALGQRSFGVERSWVAVGFLLFVLVSSVSVLTSLDVILSGRAASKVLLRSLVGFLLAAGLCRDRERAGRLGAALGLASLALALSSLVLFAMDVRNPFGGLTGPGIDYNSLCMLLVPTAPFLLGGAGSPRRSVRVLGALAFVLVIASVGLSHSRIGWAAFALLLGILFFLLPARRRLLAWASVAGLALFLVLVPDLASLVTVTDNNKYLADRDAPLDATFMKPLSVREVFTFNNRLAYGWKPAAVLIAERPLAGSGYGPETFGRRLAGSGPVLWHEHNAVLAVGVQSGLPGVLSYLLLLGAVVAALVRKLRERGGGEERLLVAALFAAVVAEYLFQGIGEPTNNGTTGILFAVLAGLTSAVTGPRTPERPGAGAAG